MIKLWSVPQGNQLDSILEITFAFFFSFLMTRFQVGNVCLWELFLSPILIFNTSAHSEHLSSLYLTGLQTRPTEASCCARGMLLKMWITHWKSSKVHSQFWAESQLFSAQTKPRLNRIMLLKNPPLSFPLWQPHTSTNSGNIRSALLYAFWEEQSPAALWVRLQLPSSHT